MPAAAKRSRRRPRRSVLVRRWVAVLLIGMIGYAYYHPLRSWFETRSELHSRRAEVQQLTAQRHELQQRLHASATLDSLARQARRLGYVRPGERLFIVRGVEAWQRARRTIRRHGR